MHLAETIAGADRPWGRATVALFDLEKAYGRAWREGLLLKLVNRRATRRIVDWLSDRSFRVRMGWQTSGWRPASEGLLQGSPLSPSLFNVFVGYLSMSIRGLEPRSSSSLTTLATGLARSKDSARLIKFCTKWKMSIN